MRIEQLKLSPPGFESKSTDPESESNSSPRKKDSSSDSKENLKLKK